MRRGSFWKGFAAGVAGGLAATCVKGRVHGPMLKAMGGENTRQPSEDATVKVARSISRPILHRDLTEHEKKVAGPIVDYAFGASMAALYGIVAECSPSVTAGGGVPFGAAVWLGAHVVTVPALGLAPPITQSAPSAEVTEFLGHLLYGAVTEYIRSRLRTLGE